MRAVNLIPNEPRTAVKPPAPGARAPATGEGAFGAYLVLGVLVLAIAAAALYVLATNSISRNESELARVQAEVETVQAQAGQLQSFADFQTLAASRKATVEGIAASRFAWQRALDDVSRALPSDVYVSSFDGTTSSASGGSSLRGAISAPAIELNGCTRDQASVARLMSRLRNVRGVTRVTLAKSERTPETAVAPAPAPAGDGKTPATTSAPCPKGSPPAFDMIVFFERAAVSPNAVPNAGAVSSGPTGATGATTPASSTAAPSPTASTGSTSSTPSTTP